MRKAYSNYKFLIENDQLLGVSLGYDFCAEHEWGIKKMQKQFGIGEEQNKQGLFCKIFGGKKFGLPLRMINKGEVILIEEKEFTFLYSKEYTSWWDKKERSLKNFLPRDLDLKYFDKNNIQTAWSEENFCVLTNDEKGRSYLKELKEAFDKKDIAIATLGGGVFEGTSLSLIIASRLPEEFKQQMYNVDKSAYDLVEYEKKIGVTELKEKTRGNGYKGEKYFCACSANWINYEDEKEREKSKKKLKTKFDIQYWVNYSDDDNNYGWYTAEEIIKWLSTPGLKLSRIRKANGKN